ncbi:MAG: cardiolipin synthase [Firmicutes bacterium]|nr:cardiolipin synthase [Bacillota bacterium]
MNQKWFRALFRRRALAVLLLLIQAATYIYFVASSSYASEIIRQALTVISVIVSLRILSKNEKNAYKMTWIFLILLLPVFGGLMYLMFSFQVSTRRFAEKATSTEAKSQKLIGLPESCYDEALSALPDYAPQISYLQNYAGFPVYTGTKTKYLSPGEEMLKCLLEALKKAEKYIFLEYFIVQEGVMWNSVLEILKKKAAAGVKVRLIYDDMGCFLLLPTNYKAELEKYGIECRVFNPFRPLLTVKQNNRDHRKIASIDGKVAFTGGINLADEYINEIERFGHWKDASVMIDGKAAWSLTLIFLQMWELCSGEDEDYYQYYPWKNDKCPDYDDGFVQPYSDSPLDSENVGEHVYLHIIQNAKKYVYINTPYLIIDEGMRSALCLAAKSGIDVRIVTPHKWDKWAVHMTTQSYYKELIDAGVKIYEYSRGFIHSKTFVSDDETATVGTTNLDFRSLYLHFECGVRMYRSKAVTELRDDFLGMLDSCKRITSDDCKRSLPIRMFQCLIRVIAPLM